MQFILGTEEDEEHVAHDLFTELDEICVKDGKDAEWKETARCVNFLYYLRDLFSDQHPLTSWSRFPNMTCFAQIVPV